MNEEQWAKIHDYRDKKDWVPRGVMLDLLLERSILVEDRLKGNETLRVVDHRKSCALANLQIARMVAGEFE